MDLREDIAGRLMGDLMNDFGLTKEQAAGFVGSLAHESAGFNTLQEVGYGRYGPNARGGWGYAQWTGPRRDAFENWASERGLDPRSYEANYGFIAHELTNTWEGPNLLSALRKADTPKEAAVISEREYFRAGVPNNQSRIEWAQSIYEDKTIPEFVQDYVARRRLFGDVPLPEPAPRPAGLLAYSPAPKLDPLGVFDQPQGLLSDVPTPTSAPRETVVPGLLNKDAFLENAPIPTPAPRGLLDSVPVPTARPTPGVPVPTGRPRPGVPTPTFASQRPGVQQRMAGFPDVPTPTFADRSVPTPTARPEQVTSRGLLDTVGSFFGVSPAAAAEMPQSAMAYAPTPAPAGLLGAPTPDFASLPAGVMDRMAGFPTPTATPTSRPQGFFGTPPTPAPAPTIPGPVGQTEQPQEDVWGGLREATSPVGTNVNATSAYGAPTGLGPPSFPDPPEPGFFSEGGALDQRKGQLIGGLVGGLIGGPVGAIAGGLLGNKINTGQWTGSAPAQVSFGEAARGQGSFHGYGKGLGGDYGYGTGIGGISFQSDGSTGLGQPNFPDHPSQPSRSRSRSGNSGGGAGISGISDAANDAIGSGIGGLY